MSDELGAWRVLADLRIAVVMIGSTADEAERRLVEYLAGGGRIEVVEVVGDASCAVRIVPGATVEATARETDGPPTPGGG